MTVLEQVEAKLEEATAGVAAARMLLTQGSPVDLAGLEGGIAEICDSIGSLPSNARHGLKDRLVGLIDDLNGLSETLAAQHAQLTDALKSASSRQRAVSAYGTGGDKASPNRTKK